MLLNTIAFDPSSEAAELMVERDKPVRDKWVDFYEHGGRICSVTNGGGAAPCLIHAWATDTSSTTLITKRNAVRRFSSSRRLQLLKAAQK